MIETHPHVAGHDTAHISATRRMTVMCVILAAVTWVVFAQTLTHGFLDHDDNVYVFQNPMVEKGLTFEGIKWAFTTKTASNWHPLTWISHMVDCQLYGLHPYGHHLTNLLLHTATVVLLFLLLRKMTGSFGRCVLVTTVFAIHPLRVESVAWVAERKDVLSGLFFVLTLWFYVRYVREHHSFRRYLTVAGCFALALMSKPSVIMLPLVMLLLDYWPLQRTDSLLRRVLEKIPLFLMSLAGCLATIWAQETGIQSSGGFNLHARVDNAVVSCVIYIRQMFWPKALAVFYPFPLHGLPEWKVALCAGFLVIATVAAVGCRRKQPWFFVGWFWWLLMLVPMLGLVQVGEQAHADRYTYLSQIGLYIAVVWSVAAWPIEMNLRVPLALGVVTFFLCSATVQATYWKNDWTLWSHADAVTPGNYMAHFNFGNILRPRDPHEPFDIRKRKMDRAIAEFQKAAELRPDFGQAWNNLGNAYLYEGQVDKAVEILRHSLEVNAKNPEAHYNLASAYVQKGDPADAIDEFQRLNDLSPDYKDSEARWARALMQGGRGAEAIGHFEHFLLTHPGTGTQEAALIHDGLGDAFLQSQRPAEAAAQYDQALHLNPNLPDAANNLAWMLATGPTTVQRDPARALSLAQHAAMLTKELDPIILNTLAQAFAANGKFPEAIATAQHAYSIAQTRSMAGLVQQIDAELKLYQAKK